MTVTCEGMTPQKIYNLYKDGDISYWDYAFIFGLIWNYLSVVEAMTYADNINEGARDMTTRGYEYAVCSLQGVGRSSEVSQVSKPAEWIILAEASSSSALERATPSVEVIPGGALGQVIIKTNGPVAKFFDLPGMELLGKYMTPAGAQVTDVYASDWSHIVIEFTMKTTREVAHGVAGSILWNTWDLLKGIASTVAKFFGGVVNAIKVIVKKAWEIIERVTKTPENIEKSLKWIAYATLGLGAIMLFSQMSKGRERGG